MRLAQAEETAQAVVVAALEQHSPQLLGRPLQVQDGGAHHSEGHMRFMMKLTIEKHMTFAEAHKAAMRQVGK